MNDSTGLMVFAEQRGGKVHPVSYELLGKGRELADKLGVGLSSVLLGNQVEAGARELIYYGADRVFLYDHPAFKDFDLLNYKHNIVTDGWWFTNSFCAERYVGGIEKGRPPYEAGCSAKDTDYLHV